MPNWIPIQLHPKTTASFIASIPATEEDDAYVTLCAWGSDGPGRMVWIDLVSGDPCEPSHWQTLDEPVDA